MARTATPAGPIGLILPTFAQDAVPSVPSASTSMRELAAVARTAEQLGVGSLWACDHLFWHGPTLECLTALTVAATATERASLGSCILQLPLRRPAAVAKQVASLQTLSGGRFVLGVGVGSHVGEYEEAGVDYEDRGRLLNEGILELRRCWSSGRAEDDLELELGMNGDEAYRPPYHQLPEPVTVPVWIGGSSVAARRRAARLGDGWIPLFVDPSRYRDEVQRLADDTVEAGRDPDSVTAAMVLFVSVDHDPVVALQRGSRWMSSMYALPPKAFERHLVSGTAAEVADTVTTYREAGAAHVVVYVTDDHPLDQFERLAAELAAPVRR